MEKPIDLKVVEGLLKLALILLKITRDERVPEDIRRDILEAITVLFN